MKTTLDNMVKTLTLTRLEIERFKACAPMLHGSRINEVRNFLQQITNTLLDLNEKVLDLQKEIEK